MKIILNYKKDKELFNKTAKQMAESLEDRNKNKSTQLRNFYEKVLELLVKSETEDWDDVIPFVKMLNSKVAYAESRRTVDSNFKNMMSDCIEQVKNKEDLNTFKLFFEAVLGFKK